MTQWHVVWSNSVSRKAVTVSEWTVKINGVDRISVKPGECVEIGRKPLRPLADDGNTRLDVADQTKSMSKRHAMFTVKAMARPRSVILDRPMDRMWCGKMAICCACRPMPSSCCRRLPCACSSAMCLRTSFVSTIQWQSRSTSRCLIVWLCGSRSTAGAGCGGYVRRRYS